MLAGLESISGGEIYIGPLVNDVPPRHRDAAMVFQNYALYPHMTVAQNIGSPLLVRHAKREEIARQVRQVAETLEIEGLLRFSWMNRSRTWMRACASTCGRRN